MNSAGIAETISSEHDLTKDKARKIIDTFLETIAATTAAGEEVNLPGFGKFKIQHRTEREGRNPANGEPMTISAATKLIFQPAKALKDRLNPA